MRMSNFTLLASNEWHSEHQFAGELFSYEDVVFLNA